MCGQALHGFFERRPSDGCNLDKGRAAKTFGAEPAVAEGDLLFVVPAGRVAICEGERAGDGPLAGFCGGGKNVGIGNVESDFAG